MGQHHIRVAKELPEIEEHLKYQLDSFTKTRHFGRTQMNQRYNSETDNNPKPYKGELAS